MNYELLTATINRSNISKGDIAEKLGLTRQGLHNKLTGVREFKVSEINALSAMLNLSIAEKEAIFFADCVGTYANNS